MQLSTILYSKSFTTNHKIVVAYELKPPDHKRETKYLFQLDYVLPTRCIHPFFYSELSNSN